MDRRPWIVSHPHSLLFVGLAAVIGAPFLTMVTPETRSLVRELGGLVLLAWFALFFVERPLREETARRITEISKETTNSIRETATQEINRVQNQTVERLLRGWLPPAHFAMLQRTTLQPFVREDVRYRIRLVTGHLDGKAIPNGYIGEIVEYKYRVRNLSEASQDARIGMAMSKECAEVLPGFPHLNMSAEFEDGMPAIQPYSGPGEDKGEYVEHQDTARLAPGTSVNAEIITKELRLLADRETLICPMPAHAMVVEFEFPVDSFEVSGSAWQEPENLRVEDLVGGEGKRFILRGPLLPGASLEIKWRLLGTRKAEN